MKKVVSISSLKVPNWERKQDFEAFLLKNLSLKEPFQISYEDQDGDKISCRNQQDFTNAKQLLEENKFKELLFQIQAFESDTINLKKENSIFQFRSETEQSFFLKNNMSLNSDFLNQGRNNQENYLQQMSHLNQAYSINQSKTQQQVSSISLNNQPSQNQTVDCCRNKLQTIHYENSINNDLVSQMSNIKKKLSNSSQRQQQTNNIQKQFFQSKVGLKKFLQNYVTKEELASVIQTEIQKNLSNYISLFHKSLKTKQQMSISSEQVQLAGFFCDICERGLSLPFYISSEETICRLCQQTLDTSVLLLKMRDEGKAVEFLSGCPLAAFNKDIMYGPRPRQGHKLDSEREYK